MKMSPSFRFRWDAWVLLGLFLFAFSGGLGWLHTNVKVMNFLFPRDYRMFSQIPDTQIWVAFTLFDSNGKEIQKWDTREIHTWRNGRELDDKYLHRYQHVDYAYEQWYYLNHQNKTNQTFLASLQGQARELNFIENLRNLGRLLAKENKTPLRGMHLEMRIWRDARKNPLEHEPRFTEWIGKQLILQERIDL